MPCKYFFPKDAASLSVFSLHGFSDFAKSSGQQQHDELVQENTHVINASAPQTRCFDIVLPRHPRWRPSNGKSLGACGVISGIVTVSLVSVWVFLVILRWVSLHALLSTPASRMRRSKTCLRSVSWYGWQRNLFTVLLSFLFFLTLMFCLYVKSCRSLTKANKSSRKVQFVVVAAAESHAFPSS